jgi:Protein of unknown function (DUF4058)
MPSPFPGMNPFIENLQLREPLPQIPVPLRQPDPDARIELQALVHRVYDTAGFQNYIYDSAPEPPLGPEDATCAQQFLHQPR